MRMPRLAWRFFDWACGLAAVALAVRLMYPFVVAFSEAIARMRID